MTDATFLIALVSLALGAWAARSLMHAAHAYRSAGGVRIVTCPETCAAAAVAIDRRHAALTALAHLEPELRLADCSRWPTRGPCDQPCLPEAVKTEHLARNIAASSFAGKRCALCAKPLTEAPGAGDHVALLSSDRASIEWPDVRPEELPEALHTRQPICWNCHIAESFRRQHPELVTERNRADVDSLRSRLE